MFAPNPLIVFFPAVLWLVAGPSYIQGLKAKMLGQYIREDGPESHHSKAGTPTMGGLLILLLVLVAWVGLWVMHPSLATVQAGLVGLTLVAFGTLGFFDDILKITKKHNKGITGWTKLAVQIGIGLTAGLWSVLYGGHHTVSVFGFASIPLGWFYPVFAAFLVTGTSNAYNLTDGLDGLAASCGFITFAALALLLGAQPDVMTLSMLLAGGCLGFLVFNRYPAQIFMGDTGSLALGGAMAVLAIIGRCEAYLLLLGGIYVIETLSVILQVGYFKLTKGKRLFRMSPIHHHFELSGWREPMIVISFTLAQMVFSVIGVLLYNRT